MFVIFVISVISLFNSKITDALLVYCSNVYYRCYYYCCYCNYYYYYYCCCCLIVCLIGFSIHRKNTHTHTHNRIQIQLSYNFTNLKHCIAIIPLLSKLLLLKINITISSIYIFFF